MAVTHDAGVPGATAGVSGVDDLTDLARQRARRAQLLGRLLVSEPGPAELDLTANIPSLAGVEASRWGVEYTRLLLREVSCHESTFTHPDGKLGRVDARLLSHYRRGEFDWQDRWRVTAPDHLGVQLLCFAHLCGQESAAWAGDRPDEATRLVEIQRSLLADHVGHWGPVACDALRRAGPDSPYGTVAAFCAEFLATEAARLRPAADHAQLESVAAPPVPRGAGPARIARRLLAPVVAGGYLLADEIGAVAADIGAPWRPSDTRARLRHVVDEATRAGALGALAAALEAIVRSWAARWSAEATRQPGAARTFRWWQARAEATSAWLVAVGDAPDAAPVLRVRDQAAAATALAALSAAGCVVASDPAPDEVVATVDALVRVDPASKAGWIGDPPITGDWPVVG